MLNQSEKAISAEAVRWPVQWPGPMSYGTMASLLLRLTRVGHKAIQLDPQIRLRILLLLYIQAAPVPIVTLYGAVSANHAVIRMHLRNLEREDIIGIRTGDNDRRARVITLSQHGTTMVRLFLDKQMDEIYNAQHA